VTTLEALRLTNAQALRELRRKRKKEADRGDDCRMQESGAKKKETPLGEERRERREELSYEEKVKRP